MNKLIQSHSELAYRLSRMASVLSQKESPTDQEKQAARDLFERAAEHERKAYITGDSFIMIPGRG